MRGVVGMVAVVLASAALAAPLPEGAGPKSDQPLFGGDERTPQQQISQIHYIDTAIKAAGTREAAAKLAMEHGWEALRAGDPRRAIQRFNEVYLLTPENGELYWGLGVASAAEGQFSNSLQLLAEAKRDLPENARLLADFGRVYYTRAANEDSVVQRNSDLREAEQLIDRAQVLEPKAPLIYMELALVKYYQGDYATAWQALNQQRALAPESVDKRFEAALTARMPKPGS